MAVEAPMQAGPTTAPADGFPAVAPPTTTRRALLGLGLGNTLSAREANTVRLPALVAALQSKDQDEGVRAFQEKRAPVWSGS